MGQDARIPIKPVIDACVKLIKSIPGMWSKFISGVKKAYSWFVTYVWNPIVAAANVIQVWITGWDIWNYFH